MVGFIERQIFFFCTSLHGAILYSKCCHETYGPQIHMQISAGRF